MLQYCRHCGRKLKPGERFCTACGTPAAFPDMDSDPSNDWGITQQSQINQLNIMALIGFILACVSILINFWGIVGGAGLVFSIIGYYQISKFHEDGKYLAIAGMIIGGIKLIYGFLTILLLDSIFSLLLW